MNWYVLICVVISAIVTIFLRAIPFLAFGGDKKLPVFIEYLGKTLPYAIIGMLVVFCMKEVSFDATVKWAPQFIAGAIVVLSYVWKKSTILSIVAGTVCYMLMVQMIF